MPECFGCDGTGNKCGWCGEAENACGCDEDSEDFDANSYESPKDAYDDRLFPCDDCGGSGE